MNSDNENEKEEASEKDNPEDNSSLKTKLEECKKERDEYLQGWKRAKADLANYKKKESDRLKRARLKEKEAVLSDVVEVLDSFRLSLLSTDGDKIERKGVELIKNQLEKVLEKHDLQEVDVSPGDTFDPETQEAVSKVDSEREEGQVVDVTEVGYKVGDKIMRPAKVKVSSGPTQDD